MLKPAIFYKEKLKTKHAKEIVKEKNKFYSVSNYLDFDLEIDKDEWNNIMYVSVGPDDEIIGLLVAMVSRRHNKITNLAVINYKKPNIIFSKDLKSFTDLVFKRGFRKINFTVVVGNPAEKMYDNFVQKYGGKIVGICTEDVVLTDGQIYDYKFYEIMKENYMKAVNNT